MFRAFRILFISWVLFFPFFSYSESLFFPKKSNEKIALILENSGIEVLGIVNQDNLGVGASANIQYGVPGGGPMSALIMLAGHAAAVSSQRLKQLDKLKEESLIFGKPFNDLLKDTTYKSLVIKSIENEKYYLSSNFKIENKSEPSLIAANQLNVKFKISVALNYSGFILDIIFEPHNSPDLKKLNLLIKKSTDKVYFSSDTIPVSDVSFADDIVESLQEAFFIYSAARDLNDSELVPVKTIRSNFAQRRFFERGNIIKETCTKKLYKNLSGVWVLVDKIEDERLKNCVSK